MKLFSKFKNFKNYRYLEKKFPDFREQDFVKDSREIYYDIVKSIFLNHHYVLLRSLTDNIYKFELENIEIPWQLKNIPHIKYTSKWCLEQLILNESNAIQFVSFNSNYKYLLNIANNTPYDSPIKTEEEIEQEISEYSYENGKYVLFESVIGKDNYNVKLEFIRNINEIQNNKYNWKINNIKVQKLN